MSTGMSELARKSQECVAKAGPALDRAARIAAALKLESEKALKAIKTQLGNDRFTVIVFGRFKGGKSTFLNALLGKSKYPIPGLDPGVGPMPVDINPATAVPSRIYYSEKPEVYAMGKPGKKESWTFANYVKQGKQKTSKAETAHFFSDIEGFEVGYPTSFCEGGVELMDTPGTEDNPAMDLLAFKAAKEADAAVLMLSHPATMGMGEEEYLQDLIASGLKSYLTVVNARDPHPPDELAMPPSAETQAVIWDRLVSRFRKKGPYKGDGLESEDIFFLNAYQAFKGRMSGNENAVRQSGIVEFEGRLAHYLNSDKRYVHLQRFLGAAEPILTNIEEVIGQQRKALQTERTTFQENLAGVQKSLEEVPKRARRIPGIIEQYRIKANAALQLSLEELYDEIEQELPAYMETQPIPSLHQESFLSHAWELVKAKFTQKKLSKEAMDIAVGYIRKRVKEWQENPPEEKGATRALKVHIDNMIKDLNDEGEAIERQYLAAQFALTGWTPPDASFTTKTASLGNRVTAAAFGALTGNIDYAVLGGMTGWSGVFTDMLGRIAIAAPLVFVFHLALPVALPIAILLSTTWTLLRGTDKLEAGIKQSAVDVLLKGTPADEKNDIPAFGGLANEPRRMRSTIATAIKEKFDAIETDVMKVVNDEIRVREETLRNQREDLMQDTTARTAKLDLLTGYEAEIRLCRAELKQAWTSAAQQQPAKSA